MALSSKLKYYKDVFVCVYTYKGIKTKKIINILDTLIFNIEKSISVSVELIVAQTQNIG
jgi:hypothetical protein